MDTTERIKKRRRKLWPAPTDMDTTERIEKRRRKLWPASKDMDTTERIEGARKMVPQMLSKKTPKRPLLSKLEETSNF